MTKKTLSLILAALTLLQMMSCSEKAQDNTEKSTETVNDMVVSAEADADTAEETEETETIDIPYTDYNGYTFNALTGDNVTYNWRELTVEELTGEPINDAFYNRNLWV